MFHTTNPELGDLEEDLRGTLHVVAHAGHASNTEFIKERQGWLKKKYGHLVSDGIYFLTEDDYTHEGLAYSKFMGVLDLDPSPEGIARECEEILNEHLL
jgi:hypothetical protein